MAFVGEILALKILRSLHRKAVCSLQYWIVFEQYVGAMALYVSPFVLRHHQSVFAASQYPAHGLAVGVR